jgi:hypothetical protein
MFETKVAEKTKTHFVFSKFFFLQKSCLLCDNVEKYCTPGQITDDNTAHALCMLDNSSYRETLGTCNTFLFHCNNGHANELLCYIIRTLPVLYNLVFLKYDCKRTLN